MGMWEPHYVDDGAYTLLEDRSEDAFKTIFNMAGNRKDFDHIIRHPDWTKLGPVLKKDISDTFEEDVEKLTNLYNDIDDQIIDIRVGVRADVKPTGEGGLVQPNSILEIEKGSRTDTIFFYGLVSVIGRSIANSINYRMTEGKRFGTKNLSNTIANEWGSLLVNASDSEVTPRMYFDNSVIREGLSKTSNGYKVRSNIVAKIANLTNSPDKPLKVYGAIADALSEAGHYKSLFKALSLFHEKKAL